MSRIRKSRQVSAEEAYREPEHESEEEYLARKLGKQPTLREERVEARKEFTTTAQDYGADGDGIARATNATYRGLWGKKPEGKRDDWDTRRQREIAVGEHLASNKIREKVQRPEPEERSWWSWLTQQQQNDEIARAAEEGGKTAREMIDDTECGGWWGWLFGSDDPTPAIGETNDSQSESEPESGGGGWLSALMGKDLWGNE